MKKISCSILLVTLVWFNSYSQNTIKIDVFATVSIQNGKLELISNELNKITAINSATNGKMTMYTYNNSTSKSGVIPFGWHNGWGLVGNCWVFGTFYEGQNGETIFVECGSGCVGYNSICGTNGGYMCKLSFNVTAP